MKKILILLLLLTSTLTLSATLYAWDLNDQPIRELNGLTLREVFEENYISSINYFSTNLTQEFVQVVDVPILPNHKYYIKTEMTIYSGYVHSFRIQSLPQTYLHIMGVNDTFILENDESTTLRTYWYDFINLSSGYIWNYIDLTTLGISSLTIQQMDNYFTQYQSRKAMNYDLDDSKATNVLTIMQDFQDILLGTEDKKGFVDYVDDFLFKERTVGFSIEWLGIYYEWTFKPFYLLGTTLFVTLMVLVLVKKFVPVA